MLKLIQLCRITQNDWYLTELGKQSSVPAVSRRSLIPPNLRKLRFVGIRDDRLFCGTLEEEAAIRNDILFMKYFTNESPLLPPANQPHTCHPERQRGISFSLSVIYLN